MKVTIVSGSGKQSKKLELQVDGVPVDDVTIYGEPPGVHVALWGDAAVGPITHISLSALPAEVSTWVMYFDYDTVPTLDSAAVHADGSRVEYRFAFNFADWKGEWSFAEYATACEGIVIARNDQTIRWEQDDESIANGFTIQFWNTPLGTTLDATVNVHLGDVEEIYLETVRQLERTVRDHTLVVHFDFPDVVRVACEQYLLYFTEFLRDVGVGATAELKEDAGAVLFAITPESADEALDRIREALCLYLELPRSPLRYSDAQTEIAVHKLAANIRHLQGQLELAYAVVRSQEATIAAQHLTIERIASGEILSASVRKHDREEILGGVIAITKYAGKGFEVNLPDMFRKLRKLFNRNAG